MKCDLTFFFLTCQSKLFNPITHFRIYYFSFKKNYPTKAQTLFNESDI